MSEELRKNKRLVKFTVFGVFSERPDPVIRRACNCDQGVGKKLHWCAEK